MYALRLVRTAVGSLALRKLLKAKTFTHQAHAKVASRFSWINTRHRRTSIWLIPVVRSQVKKVICCQLWRAGTRRAHLPSYRGTERSENEFNSQQGICGGVALREQNSRRRFAKPQRYHGTVFGPDNSWRGPGAMEERGFNHTATRAQVQVKGPIHFGWASYERHDGPASPLLLF